MLIEFVIKYWTRFTSSLGKLAQSRSVLDRLLPTVMQFVGENWYSRPPCGRIMLRAKTRFVCEKRWRTSTSTSTILLIPCAQKFRLECAVNRATLVRDYLKIDYLTPSRLCRCRSVRSFGLFDVSHDIRGGRIFQYVLHPTNV